MIDDLKGTWFTVIIPLSANPPYSAKNCDELMAYSEVYLHAELAGGKQMEAKHYRLQPIQ